ncbi:MAG TPA: hypothetical protein VE664_04380 [Actinomycetes bacterium]|nr:hypothetical protein [Actinomycetes bacterium]
MSRTVTIARGLVRLTAIVQIVLGVLFWSGNATGLIDLHQLSGIIMVLSLEVLVLAAARAGVDRRLVVIAGIWGVVVVALGLSQTSLLQGSAHWVIEVLHLLVGLAAIGQAEALATRTQQVAPQEPRLS